MSRVAPVRPFLQREDDCRRQGVGSGGIRL